MLTETDIAFPKDLHISIHHQNHSVICQKRVRAYVCVRTWDIACMYKWLQDKLT